MIRYYVYFRNILNTSDMKSIHNTHKSEISEYPALKYDYEIGFQTK